MWIILVDKLTVIVADLTALAFCKLVFYRYVQEADRMILMTSDGTTHTNNLLLVALKAFIVH